ncbi:hypothetical protein F5146DRAFT_1000555 [Armillaria mellea]|nr:hypothetical protein F5146DRAFT_1000555 [Armillaria mellea]
MFAAIGELESLRCLETKMTFRFVLVQNQIFRLFESLLKSEYREGKESLLRRHTPDRLGFDTAHLKGATVNFFSSRTPSACHKSSSFRSHETTAYLDPSQIQNPVATASIRISRLPPGNGPCHHVFMVSNELNTHRTTQNYAEFRKTANFEDMITYHPYMMLCWNHRVGGILRSGSSVVIERVEWYPPRLQLFSAHQRSRAPIVLEDSCTSDFITNFPND